MKITDTHAMKIKTYKIDSKMLEAYRRLQIDAYKRNLYVDPESMKLTTRKLDIKTKYWNEGDQDTPDLYKGDDDERTS